MFDELEHLFYELNKDNGEQEVLLKGQLTKLKEDLQKPVFPGGVYYDRKTQSFRTEKACSKCSGTGYIPQYNHVQGGVCFQCMGNRYTQPLINK